MAMDFLERPARLANKIMFVTVMFSALACSRGKHNLQALPETDPQLKRQNGILSYQGRPFSGLIFLCNVKGDTLLKEMYADGLKEGRCYKYYDGAVKKEDRYYSKGKGKGIHRGWFPNGQLKFQYSYKNDIKEGLAEEWYADGKKYKSMHYRNGQEEGLQQMWGEDGKLRANYEARNGRNYGLTGTKNCKNVWQELHL